MKEERAALTAKDEDVYDVLSDDEIFADLYNGSLFDGQQIIRPGMLQQENEKKLIETLDRNGAKIILKKERDVEKSAVFGGGRLAVMLAAEGQRMVHYGMPVRNMIYDILDYLRQIEELNQQHKLVRDLKSGAEYLSGLKKEDRLLPVVTLVFHYGEDQNWDAPLSLHDMLAIPKEMKDYKACIPDYHINLISSKTVKSENFRTGLREVFELLPLLKDKEGMKKLLKEKKEHYSRLEPKRGWVIGKFINIPSLKNFGKEEKGEVNMCTAIEEMIEDGRAEGVGQGEERVNRLNQILILQSRYEELCKAANDKEYQQKLFHEYNII